MEGGCGVVGGASRFGTEFNISRVLIRSLSSLYTAGVQVLEVADMLSRNEKEMSRALFPGGSAFMTERGFVTQRMTGPSKGSGSDTTGVTVSKVLIKGTSMCGYVPMTNPGLIPPFAPSGGFSEEG
jgi:hypothetical protein